MKHPLHEGEIIYTEMINEVEYTFSMHPAWGRSILVESTDKPEESFVFSDDDKRPDENNNPIIVFVLFEIATRLMKNMMLFV